jgi:hypothetical protein
MTKPKLTLHKALDLLRRPDARMIMTNGNGDERNRRSEYWITPACICVPPSLAHQIKDHPQVTGGKDGMWPDHDQTWRIGGE